MNFSAPSKLFVVAAGGGTPVDLHVEGEYGTWGPTKLAWLELSKLPGTVWTANPDGSGRQEVAKAKGTEQLASPAWSRDGRLAFVEGKATVGVVSGAAVKKVALPFVEVESLAWSPDSTRFVVVGLTKGAAVYDVYTVRTDGTGLRRLTKNLEAYSVSWR